MAEIKPTATSIQHARWPHFIEDSIWYEKRPRVQGTSSLNCPNPTHSRIGCYEKTILLHYVCVRKRSISGLREFFSWWTHFVELIFICQRIWWSQHEIIPFVIWWFDSGQHDAKSIWEIWEMTLVHAANNLLLPIGSKFYGIKNPLSDD